MKIIKSTKNIKGKHHIKNSTSGNISIKAATNKNSSVRLQMKEELMDQILSEIKSKLKEIMTSYEFGYDDNEWEDYSGADIYLDNQGYIVITVYAEVSYHGLVEIMDALNLIVQKYDSHAYFDAETSGRCSAYINPDNVPSNMYPYDDIQNSEKIYSSQSQYTNRTVLKYKNKSFTIYDNSDSINLPADADFEALRKWKAQISQHAGPYNDADEDYEWASLSNGVVSYYRRGKLVDTSYYMSPSDWGVETLGEWFQLVINDVIKNLYEANRDVPDHMVYNSTDIEDSSDDSIMFEGNNYEYVTNNDGYWIYRAVIDGKGVWRAMPQGSNESQFEELSFPISYAQARGFEPINEPTAITKLRKDLGKKLLSKSGRSVEATTEYLDIGGILGEPNARYSSEDLRSIYEEGKHHDPLISIYQKGKHYDPLISQYDSYESWFKDIEQYLYEIYSDTEDITSSTDDKAFIENIEDIIDGLEDNGYDLSRIRSIRRGLLELFGYKGKDADIIIHDLVAGRFIDPNDWVDKDYTPGIYSATEEGYKTSENYKGRRIKLLNDGTGYAIFEKGEMIDYGFKSLEDAEAAIDEYDDIYQDDVQVYSDTAEDEEDLPMVDQEYDSAATSINSNKLPAIYRMVSFNEGDVVVDFGGGKFDNAVKYIRDKGATLCVYDPYNRSAEHNREVLKILRENGGADAAVNSNVLNVIKEPEARKNVLENIARITKPGAPIYITVYEGRGDGQEGPTKSGYQLNRKTADYLEEIQEVFPDATRRGKLITAHNSRVSAATNTANIGAKITCSDVDSDAWMKLAQKQVLDSDGFYTDYTMYSNEDGTSYIFMFGDEDIYGPDPRYADYECSNWDEAAEWWNDYNGFGEDDILSSTILDANPEFRNNFEEAIDFFYESYPATVELTDEVDEDYDTLYKAYVKETGSLYQQKPGIVYIDINWDSGEILQALEETAESIGIEQYPDDDIEMSTFSDKNDVTSSTIKDSYEVELDPEESMIDMNIDQYIIVDSEGSWNYDSDDYDWASSDGEGSDWYSDNGVRLDDSTGVVEKIDELIEPHIPIEPGTYRVQGYIELYYTVSGVYENRYDYTEDDYSSDINSDFGSAEYNKKLSKIENIEVTKI